MVSVKLCFLFSALYGYIYTCVYNGERNEAEVVATQSFMPYSKAIIRHPKLNPEEQHEINRWHVS